MIGESEFSSKSIIEQRNLVPVSNSIAKICATNRGKYPISLSNKYTKIEFQSIISL